MRGRSFQAVFVFGLLLIGVAYLSANFSPRHPRTVALDIGFSGIRFTLILLNLFWIQELLAKEIERKTILHSFAYPLARSGFVLGRYFSVLALGCLATLVLGLSLLTAVALASAHYSQEFPVNLGAPYVLTLIGLWLDAAVVASVALAVSAVSTVTIMPLAIGVAFAIGGKALGATIAYLARGADGDSQLTARFDPLIDMVRWLILDLSRLDWRLWPMYDTPIPATDIMLPALLALAYIALLLMVGAYSFSRREFS